MSLLQPKRATTKVKLVRDAVGEWQLTTERGELLKNIYVKNAEHIEGRVNTLLIEVVYVDEVCKPVVFNSPLEQFMNKKNR